ncbi:MAG: hypothetical protein ACJ71N_13995 [Terriglobales bacterium]
MLLLLAVVSSCPAQTASDEETTFFDKWIKLRATDFIVSAMAGVDSEIESLRAGIRADKPHLLAEAMNFTESESKIFWPVYRKYEGDLTSINYQRVALNREYALKNNSLTDREAKSMLDKALSLESGRVQLKKDYAQEFQRKGLSATSTARFFQLEDRLDAMLDLKLVAELPSSLARKDLKAESK